jgi:Fur family ferric uptake transcriptional regulator
MTHSQLERFEQLLRKHTLKVTQPRLHVLSMIAAKSTAISQPELEKQLGTMIDRVTLYRALSTFEEKGIVHKIFDLQGTATYALCSTGCTHQHHHDQHLHFLCDGCNQVFCLDELELPQPHLPSGYTLQSMHIHAVGKCPNCSS